MKIDSVEFVVSAVRLDDYPRDPLRELALVGRSNVGKSSLINALVGRAVARTSGTPGKTRVVNFYRVRPARGRTFYLVDLPGFGHTDSRAARGAFEAVTRTYFESRAAVNTGLKPRAAPETPGLKPRAASAQPGAAQGFSPVSQPRLAAVLLLVDGRHPGLPIDLAADSWLRTLGARRLVVATKFDKLSRSERARALAALERAFQGPVVPVSAATGENLDELWRQILPCVNPTPPRCPPGTPSPPPSPPPRSSCPR